MVSWYRLILSFYRKNYLKIVNVPTDHYIDSHRKNVVLNLNLTITEH